MDLGEGEVIDASQKGSILRFVNHSCGPNAETQKWAVRGKRRIGLFATEVIEKGTEVRGRCFCLWTRCCCIEDFCVVLRETRTE